MGVIRKRKVLVISDACYPFANTGFSIVVRKVIDAFLHPESFGSTESSWEVVHFARGMKPHHQNGVQPEFTVHIPPDTDPNGYGYMDSLCEWEHPDVAVIQADPGSALEWRRSVKLRGIPNLLYTPTEGEPILSPWSTALQEVLWTPTLAHGGQITTYTHFSRRAIEACLQQVTRPVEVLPHGVDHAPFRVYTDQERQEARKRLGWSKYFVVMNVARNAGRKEWPRLLDAMVIAKSLVPNIKLYAHTVPFEHFHLGGHNLLELVKDKGLTDYVSFPSRQEEPTRGIPYEGWGQGKKEVGLIDLYNAADLFVYTSGAEGWNLPQTEAAACGLPVVAPQYSGGWEAAKDFAQGLGEPYLDDFATHSSGQRYLQVKPSEVAKHIVRLSCDPKKRAELREKGISAAAKMKWEPTVKRLVELAGELVYDTVVDKRG